MRISQTVFELRSGQGFVTDRLQTPRAKTIRLPFGEETYLNRLQFSQYSIIKAGNHVVLMIGFTEFRAGIRTKHVRK